MTQKNYLLAVDLSNASDLLEGRTSTGVSHWNRCVVYAEARAFFLGPLLYLNALFRLLVNPQERLVSLSIGGALKNFGAGARHAPDEEKKSKN